MIFDALMESVRDERCVCDWIIFSRFFVSNVPSDKSKVKFLIEDNIDGKEDRKGCRFGEVDFNIKFSIFDIKFGFFNIDS